jgi:hypothetical protein
LRWELELRLLLLVKQQPFICVILPMRKRKAKEENKSDEIKRLSSSDHETKGDVEGTVTARDVAAEYR